MYSLVKSLLFQLDPETAHHFSMQNWRRLTSVIGVRSIFKPMFQSQDFPVKKMGLTFRNPVGLAAGFDKNGDYINALAALGFGFIEVGTITPMPQPGNPKPRLFRLPKDQALINRMGFNNLGVDVLRDRLERLDKPEDLIIGGNIGKNKVTDNKVALRDYEICVRELHEVVDYFVVNVSSPNTPGLRELQEKEPLTRICTELQNRNQGLAKPRPFLLKIAPDVTDGQLDDIIEIVQAANFEGIIINNTTISRADLKTAQQTIDKIGNGGLSGLPVKQRSIDVLQSVKKQTQDKLTIIGVGGIMNPTDAVERLQAGADLIQVYTGFIYYGPSLAQDFVKEIKKRFA